MKVLESSASNWYSCNQAKTWNATFLGYAMEIWTPVQSVYEMICIVGGSDRSTTGPVACIAGPPQMLRSC